MIYEVIERNAKEGLDAIKAGLKGIRLKPREFSDEPLYEETPYPQEGTLDELDVAVDAGLITDAESDELAAFLAWETAKASEEG